MNDGLLATLLAAFRGTSPLEVFSLVTGLAYALLVVWRRREAWVAGGLSSAALAWLAWRAGLPMQSILQCGYVAMSVYGFWHWSSQDGAPPPVERLPLKFHLLGIAGIFAASAGSAFWLVSSTSAAAPWLDSLTTFGSLFATWLTARMKLENWLYWLVIDSGNVALFGAQGLVGVAALYAIYLVIAAFGFFTWLKRWRADPAPI